MSPPSFDWLGFLISLYCRVDFSHNISPNLSSFQTQLIQWQRVCRQVQCDSAWFFHQPWNITKKVQVMKKHLTQHIFTNNLSIFLYFKIQLFADSFISFLQNFEKKIPYQYLPTQSFNIELRESKQTCNMWPHHDMSGISVSLNTGLLHTIFSHIYFPPICPICS